MAWSSEKALDALFKAVCIALSVLAITPIIHVLATVAVRGGSVIARVGVVKFLTNVPPAPGSREPGGIGPAIVGTVIISAIATAIGLPLSLLLAILAVEFSESPIARLTRFLSKTLAGMPTIAVSMLVYALVVVPMHGASALAGGISLAIVLLPYATTYMESCLDALPKEYREAGYALGMTRLEVIRHVVLGMCGRGIAVSAVLSIARALGETAPLLFTAGSSHYSYPTSIYDPASSITLLVYEFGLSPFRELVDVAWGAAFVLVASYLTIVVMVKLFVKGVSQ